MSENIVQMEYKPGEELVIRIKSPKLDMLPGPAKEHLAAARKEIMMALRDMLESSLAKGSKSPETKTKRRKIVVE